MKRSYEEPTATAGDTAGEQSGKPIPYKGYTDWREWVDANYTKFLDNGIKAGDPSFYRFLMEHREHKLRQQAQSYLRSKWHIIPTGLRPVRKQKLTREEFIENVNKVRIRNGEPELLVIDREEEQDIRKEGLERIMGDDD